MGVCMHVHLLMHPRGWVCTTKLRVDNQSTVATWPGCAASPKHVASCKQVRRGPACPPARPPACPPACPPAEYGCYHPLRDVLATPWDARSPKWVNNTKLHTLDSLLAAK